MARIRTKTLAALCRRVSVALESGIAERQIWQREAERVPARARPALASIAQSVAIGQGVSDGIESVEGSFPPLFRELAALGERTGKQSAVFKRLADHYEHRVRLRREFLSRITWPMIQLTAAVLIVGFLIWILGVISKQVESLGFGVPGFVLQGTEGLIIYVIIVGTLIGIGICILLLIRSGTAWSRPIQQIAVRLPVVGNSVRMLALSQLAWTLGLSLEAGMDVRRALPFALNSTRLYFFACHASAVAGAVDRGEDVFSALFETRAFPEDFLDTVQVGEQSGRLDESLLRLADQYQERARAAIAALTKVAAFIVWAFVAVILIVVIIGFVSWYAQLITGMASPR